MINNFLELPLSKEEFKKYYFIANQQLTRILQEKGFIPVYVDTDKNMFCFYKDENLINYLKEVTM